MEPFTVATKATSSSTTPEGVKKRQATEAPEDESATKLFKIDNTCYEIEIEAPEPSDSQEADPEAVYEFELANPSLSAAHLPEDGSTMEHKKSQGDESTDGSSESLNKDVLDELLSGRYKISLPNHEDKYPPADGIANTIEVAPNYERTGFHFHFSIGELKKIFSIEDIRPEVGSDPVELTEFGYINLEGEQEEVSEGSEHDAFLANPSTIEFPVLGKVQGSIVWGPAPCVTIQFEGIRIGNLAEWDEYKAWVRKRDANGESGSGSSTHSTKSSSRESDDYSDTVDGQFDTTSSPNRLEEMRIAALPWYRRIYVSDENDYREEREWRAWHEWQAREYEIDMRNEVIGPYYAEMRAEYDDDHERYYSDDSD